MANATAGVPMTTVPFTEENMQWPLAATVQNYFPGAMIGLNEAGYATKFDDAASLKFLGVNAGSVKVAVETGDSAGDNNVTVEKPRYITAAIASAALTDVGRLVYAAYDNAVQFATGTYGNVVGRVVKRLSATLVLIDTWDTKGAARRLAATGAQTISKYDIGKTMFIANTTTVTLTLPAVADCDIGGELKFVKDHASDTNAVTLDGNASEIIDAATTLATMDAAYDTATLTCNGTGWVVLNRDIA